MRIDWKAPVPLQSADQVVNEYPIAVFPFWAQDIIREISESKGVPIAMPAHAFIGVVSAIIAGHVFVKCYDNPTPTGLWTLLLAPSGTGKDTVYDLIGKPMTLLESYNEYNLNDTTAAALVEQMDNPFEKAIVFDSEGAFYEDLLHATKQLNNYLHMYDGKNVKVTRATKPTIDLQHPSLVLALSTQNDSFATYQKSNGFVNVTAKGLVQRFLYCAPNCNVHISGTRKNVIDDDIAQRYAIFINTIFHRLQKLSDAMVTFDCPETENRFNQICEDYRSHRVDIPNANEFMNTYWSKLDNKLIRLSAILAVSHQIAGIDSIAAVSLGKGRLRFTLTKDILDGADQLARYYLEEYRKLFSPYTPDANRASIILRYLMKSEHKADTVLASKLWGNLRRTKGLEVKSEFEEALAMLEDHHYIILEQKKNKGARSSVIIHINPSIYGS